MERSDIKKDLHKLLRPSRFEHTLAVEYTACCLAMRYGADMKKADLAGLLHDCAKHLSASKKLECADYYGVSVSEYERKNPELLHAKLGACIARDKYGIDDPEILSAITWHTTGRPDMTLLDKIIFIADYIEPGRFKAENLEEIRALAFLDIDQCLLKILSDTVSYLSTRNIVTDPMTKRTWEYYREILKEEKKR